ncbi:MAG: histidine phosphatase family protein [Chloroflexi bacterium]|nr:histidine phosphatase family protein [Chloroflexota bacterium]
MTRLILVRHGETIWNVDRRFQGQSDIGLNVRGEQQAELTAQRLSDEAIEAVYSSDLQRCLETAGIIARDRGLAVRARPELREINFGEWEGMTFQEISTHSPGYLDRMRADTESVRPPGGETWAEVQQRVDAIFGEIRHAHPIGIVLVVSHVNPLRVLICSLLGCVLSQMFRVRWSNCGVSIVEVGPSGGTILLLNDDCHVRGLKL